MRNNLNNLIICVCCVIFCTVVWFFIGVQRSRQEAEKQRIEQYFNLEHQYDTTTVYNRIKIYDKIRDLRAEMEEDD